MILGKKEIEKDLESGSLAIRPLLDEAQIGEISVDLRLGYDFSVSIQGRRPYINASVNGQNSSGQLLDFFQDTRRKLGDTFILHPNQTVLGVTLEYIKLPQDIFANVNLRSSYARLGLYLHTNIQPGYVGCISLELINTSKTPINLTIGASIFQMQLIKLNESHNYFNRPRKYICQVRPQLSAIENDDELKKLNQIWRRSNHSTD